jgi:pimeloyl-ACP methyl ester carboxylesterase
VLRLVMVALLVVVAGGVALNAVLYHAARRVRRREQAACPFDDDDPLPWPARVLAALRHFGGECAATVFVFLTVPLGWGGGAIDAAAGRPVLLVGGWLAPPAAFRWLARRLRRDGWHPIVVRFRLSGDDVESAAAGLAAAVEHVRREAGVGGVDVVAHGAGGLVVRAHVRATGRASGVARLLTLGTPHQGSGAWPSRHLRPGSPLLARLAEDDPVPAQVETVAIYSRDDALVVPTTRAYYPGAFNIELGGVGHVSLLFSGRVYALVRENLAAESSRDSSAALPAG